MKKFIKPLVFVVITIAALAGASGCKKCIICTVKDVNSGKVLYITPEKCGKEEEFKALQDSVAGAYNCWACAVYDSLAYDSLDEVAATLRLDSAFRFSLDSLGIDTLDSVKCGSLTKLELNKNLTTTLVKALKQNEALYLKCFKDNYPNKSECD